MPKVSVILPVLEYNSHVQQAVDSVLEQEYESLELIVVDKSGKSENYPERVLEDPKVKYVEQTGSGLAQARNQGMDESRGDYIALLDGDDIALPGRIKRQVEILEHHDDVGLVYSPIDVFNENGLEYSSYGGFRAGKIRPPEAFRKRYVEGYLITITSVMFDQDLDIRFNEELEIAEDDEFFLRLLQDTTVYEMDEPYTKKRWGESHDQMTDESRKILQNLTMLRKKFYFQSQEISFTDYLKALSTLHGNYTYDFYKRGETVAALKCALKSFLYWPLNPRTPARRFIRKKILV